MFRRKKRARKFSATRAKSLRLESLESRCLLTGVVGVTLNGDTLEFRGDNQANKIEVRQTGEPWEHKFRVTGIDTDLDKDNDGTVDGTVLEFAGVKNFDVQLAQNDDTFSFLSHTNGSSRSVLDGYVSIVNDLGTNTNNVGSITGAGVLVKDYLTITRTDADNIFSTSNTSLYKAEIDGAVEITVGLTARNNNGGDSTTIIQQCDFGDTLAFQGREGKDVFTLQDSNIGGDATIYTTETTNYNDAGESLITFTATAGKVNKVEGSLEIVTANDFSGEDFISFNATETESAVTIDVHDGAAQVLVQNGSKLGTELNAGNQDLVVTYGESAASQQKQFELKDSTVQWSADVSTDAAGRLKVTVEDSDIGANTMGYLYVTGDVSDDQVSLIGATIGSLSWEGADIDLGGGNNSVDVEGSAMYYLYVTTGDGFDTVNLKNSRVLDVWFESEGGDDSLTIQNSAAHPDKLIDFLYAEVGAGDDEVYLENVIAKNTTILLEDDEDVLTLLSVSLLGPLTLDGGAGGSDDDTFRADQAATNAYLLFATDFEHQEIL